MTKEFQTVLDTVRRAEKRQFCTELVALFLHSSGCFSCENVSPQCFIAVLKKFEQAG